MPMRAARSSDLTQVVAIERLPESRKYVGQWSDERHARTFAGTDARYFVWEDDAGAIAGYAVLRGFDETSGSIELKRLVVARPGQGIGRLFLTELMRVVFRAHGAHRMFLDVFEDNACAQHLYASLGFIQEGVMREAAPRDGRYFSLYLMSVLESEYQG